MKTFLSPLLKLSATLVALVFSLGPVSTSADTEYRGSIQLLNQPDVRPSGPSVSVFRDQIRGGNVNTEEVWGIGNQYTSTFGINASIDVLDGRTNALTARTSVRSDSPEGTRSLSLRNIEPPFGVSSVPRIFIEDVLSFRKRSGEPLDTTVEVTFTYELDVAKSLSSEAGDRRYQDLTANGSLLSLHRPVGTIPFSDGAEAFSRIDSTGLEVEEIDQDLSGSFTVTISPSNPDLEFRVELRAAASVKALSDWDDLSREAGLSIGTWLENAASAQAVANGMIYISDISAPTGVLGAGDEPGALPMSGWESEFAVDSELGVDWSDDTMLAEAVIPEPSLAALLIGMGALAAAARRRR